jgi:DNA-binding CsgD family transcriptional regulator
LAVRHISAAEGARLSGADLRAALGFVARVSAARDPDDFADEALRGLTELVRCDYASYVETSPRAGRATAITEPRDAMFPEAPEALARNLEEHPLVQYYATTGDVRALKMSDFLTHRQFVRTKLFAELFRPADTHHLLAAVLPTAPGLVVGFSLHRAAGDFAERDRALLDLLEPHLAQAYERSLLRLAVGRLDGSGRDRRTLVVLGRDRLLLHAVPDAMECLEHHFGRRPADEVLPRQVAAWIDGGCTAPLVVTTDLRRLRIDSVGRRPAALLLSERPLAPAAPSLGHLSPREAEVLSLVAEGCPNAEIGRRLCVTPSTVKRHLEHVYEKLGVHTRTAAAAVAWAETGHADDGHPSG